MSILMPAPASLYIGHVQEEDLLVRTSTNSYTGKKLAFRGRFPIALAYIGKTSFSGAQTMSNL